MLLNEMETVLIFEGKKSVQWAHLSLATSESVAVNELRLEPPVLKNEARHLVQIGECMCELEQIKFDGE